MVARISRIGKGIADDVERYGDKWEHNGREDELVAQGRHHHQLTAFIDEVAQRGDVQRQAETDVGEKNLRGYGHGHS